MPAAPGTPAAAPSTPAPAANPFGTPAPAAAPNPFGTPGAAPATPPLPATDVKIDTVPVQETIPPGGFRVLAPGVLTTIASPVSVDDAQSQHDLIELPKDYGVRPNSKLKPAQAVSFVHDVWGLEFAFKPVRYIRLPGADGKERLIWYIVFKVKNGPIKRYDRDKIPPYDLIPVMVDKPFLFIPRFELESHDVKKMYADKVIPEAIPLIQKREDKNRRLLSTAEMTGEIPFSTPDIDRSVWGVATWEGVDPRTDRFTIYVHGLTNAYKWTDSTEEPYKPGDPIGKGRTYQYQVLKLNFWRPSDTKYEHEEEIRFGIPGLDVAYEWFYK